VFKRFMDKCYSVRTVFTRGLRVRVRFKSDILLGYLQERKRESMKKWAAAVGIILLMLTPILLTYYNQAYGTVSTPSGDWTVHPNVWEMEVNFSANDIILLEFSPNIFWFSKSTAFEVSDSGVPYIIVDMNITDPRKSSNESLYELWYTFDATKYQYSLYNATMLLVGDGINQTVHVAPTFRNTNGFILGAAELNGTYHANVTFVGGGYMIPGSDYRSNGTYPPANFALNWAHNVIQKSYPYATFLYAAFFTIPAGFAFLIYGLKKPKQNHRASKRVLKRTGDSRFPRSA